MPNYAENQQAEADRYAKRVNEIRQAQERADQARQKFIEREGYDRMSKPPQEEFDPTEFDTAPTTPARAGPGLGVSPTQTLVGVGAGVIAGLGGALLAGASNFQAKQNRPETGVFDNPTDDPGDIGRPVLNTPVPTGSVPPVISGGQFGIVSLVSPYVPVIGKKRRRRFPYSKTKNSRVYLNC